MISVKNLTKVYKIGKKGQSKDVVALNNVSVDFPDKGLVFLLGKSGSGKSTLLNLLMAGNNHYAGEIRFGDAELREIRSESLYEMISIIQQN
ncbi:MAG: ATP-binding cassette domain-containing protein, partial [Clostridia bacterium]|nr:ATP-binding cassette domain-containing protein [Clostridia bacterium]